MCNRNAISHALLLASLTLAPSACSSRPRYFKPQLSEAAPVQSKVERDVWVCDQLVRKGYRGDFKNAALQASGGAVAGLAAGAAAVSLTAAPAASSLNLAAGLGNAAGAMTVVTPLIMFGVSRAIRSGREKKHKVKMSQCLTELGYEPSGWAKAKRPKKGSFNIAEEPTTPSPETPVSSSGPVLPATMTPE